MPAHDSSEAVIRRLKEEIERLTEKQSKALKEAIYVGMRPDEAKQYDERRTRITQLVEQLGKLEKGQR